MDERAQIANAGIHRPYRRVQRGHHFSRDEEARRYSIANAANVDCILLGRKTATGFIHHWKSVAANPKDPIVTMASPGRFPSLRPTLGKN
jgi:hypothetical protein